LSGEQRGNFARPIYRVSFSRRRVVRLRSRIVHLASGFSQQQTGFDMTSLCIDSKSQAEVVLLRPSFGSALTCAAYQVEKILDEFKFTFHSSSAASGEEAAEGLSATDDTSLC
jgi:hypothetical protein